MDYDRDGWRNRRRIRAGLAIAAAGILLLGSGQAAKAQGVLQGRGRNVPIRGVMWRLT